MKIKSLNELTPSEYYYSFLDKLNSLVNKTFSKDEELMFVTYQPKYSEVDYNKVTAITKKLFNPFKYVMWWRNHIKSAQKKIFQLVHQTQHNSHCQQTPSRTNPV